MKTAENYDQYMITGMVPAFEPIEVIQAAGATMTGSDGQTYIDAFSGISVVNAGHQHPKILAAAQEQMEKLIHCCTYVYYNPKAGEIAKELARVTPGALQKNFLANSGAEAIEGAMRLSKHYTGKNEFIALTHSFHGRTNATLSITGNSGRKLSGGPYLSGVSFAPAPYSFRCPFGSSDDEECAARSAEYLRQVIKYQTAGNVAAFIAEPILGEGGIIVPHEKYYQWVKEILDEQGILFICDEVQTGFARTGKLFAIEHYGIDPDIMTMAKGIANGFPLSSFIAKPEIGDAFTPGSHLSTFGGNPVSCAAALANLEVIEEEQLVENAKTQGDFLMKGLKELQNKHALIGEVRGKGLMIGIELISDRMKTPAAAEAKQIRARAREMGVLLGVGGSLANVVRLQPPCCITEEQSAKILDIFSRTLNEL